MDSSKNIDVEMEGEDIDDEFNDDDLEIKPINEVNQSKNQSNSKGTNFANVKAAAVAATAAASIASIPDLPELTRKDKTLKEVLDLMDGDFAPIIPDAVTDYYLAKNGFETTDVKIKRLLALATQKFISDIAQDAYEYSRIRSSSAVYNSANPQTRAKQLLQGQQYANQQTLTGVGGGNSVADGGNVDEQLQQQLQLQPSHSGSSAGNQQGKIVLTIEDLSNALSEYGLNTARSDFYR